MDQQVGSGSLCFAKAPFIIGTASVVGTKEGEGPLADAFDCIGPDDKFGQQTWEAAESSLQKEALTLALGKADQKPEDMRYLFAGDLLGQLIASSFGLKTFEIPLFGLYGACSTCGEALALSAMTVAAGYADRVAAVTSSHFASAEKQFRFPLEYANQRPVSATWTVTGGGAFILSKEAKQPLAKVAGVTTGKIVDYGIKDSMNMGAVMAPAIARIEPYQGNGVFARLMVLHTTIGVLANSIIKCALDFRMHYFSFIIQFHKQIHHKMIITNYLFIYNQILESPHNHRTHHRVPHSVKGFHPFFYSCLKPGFIFPRTVQQSPRHSPLRLPVR